MSYITDMDGDRIAVTKDTIRPRNTLVSVWEKPKHAQEQIAGVSLNKDDLLDLILLLAKRLRELS